MTIKKISTLMFLSLLIAAISLPLYIKYQFSQLHFKTPLKSIHQLWSHRGAGNTYAENSIAAFEEAIQSGAKGIEIDIYFDMRQRKFKVTHDPPEKKIYPDLEEYFQRFKDSTSYWLDLKNLNEENADAISEVLNQLSQKYDLKNNLFVESSRANLLNILQKQEINCLYWVQFNRTSSVVKELKLLYLKYLIAKYKFSGITTSDYYYDTEFKTNFKQIPVFVFHPTDTNKINVLFNDSNVNVILTDNYFKFEDEPGQKPNY